MATLYGDRIRLNELINNIELSFLEKIGNRKLICYGASAVWPDVVRILAINDLVEFFVDRDKSRWGEIYYGKEIKSPIEIANVPESQYAVLVLTGAFEEVSVVLDKAGLIKDKDYFNIYQYIHIYKEVSFDVINKYIRFLDTVPPEIGSVSSKKESERIGIVLTAEGLNFGTTYLPYLVSLFLVLRWKGYNVKLIVDRLRWEGDLELYEGHCAVCDHVRDLVIGRLEKLVPSEDILYLDADTSRALSEEDERECERIAGYSAAWSKWYNCWNSRFRSKEAVQRDFSKIFKKNLAYIDAFFEKNHFDTINAITALHKMAGIYNYAGRKRNIRVSSQDGIGGYTLICANGPSSYGDDIPRFLNEMWAGISGQEEFLERAEKMWNRRRGASVKLSEVSYGEYERNKKEVGYDNISFQASQEELIQRYDVIIPLNLQNDGAALGVATLFDDMRQWLEQTLDFVIRKGNGTVLIREHPVGKIMPQDMANSELYTVYPEILERYAGDKRLRYVSSEEELNLYQYIEECKVLIPWTSTVGVEAGLMGKNVLVHTDVYYKNAAFATCPHTREEYFECLERCVINDEFLPGNKSQAYHEALKYFYFTMNRILTTDFTIVNSNESDWKFKSFRELLEAEGVEEIVQIVAENVPSVYLVERQRRRLGQL